MDSTVTMVRTRQRALSRGWRNWRKRGEPMADEPQTKELNDDAVQVNPTEADWNRLVADAVNLHVGFPTVEFDGHRFRQMPEVLWALDLAYRARRGDEAATAVLTAFNVTIKDADNRSYWPMKTAEEEMKK